MRFLMHLNLRVEFECEFLGSTNTLISGLKLQQLVYKDPIYEHDKVKIYEQPIKAEDGEFIEGEQNDEEYALESESNPLTDANNNTDYETVSTYNPATNDGLIDFSEANPFGEVRDA